MLIGRKGAPVASGSAQGPRVSGHLGALATFSCPRPEAVGLSRVLEKLVSITR
jgi:hypothetical protein